MHAAEAGPVVEKLVPGTGRTPYPRPRRPEHTDLYRVVQENLETLLEQVALNYDRPLPRYVTDELDKYLRCGIFAHGFSVLECDRCAETFLVALSCKGRTICPSCGGRRMCNSAANLVDRVLPDVPYRQFVFTVPYDLRLPLARDAKLLGKVVSLFHEAVQRYQRERAKQLGYDAVHSAIFTVIQRFGSSLNLHPHLHSLVPDGVFVLVHDKLVYVPLGAPRAEDLAKVIASVERRLVAWGRRLQKKLRDKEGALHPPTSTALDALMQAASFPCRVAHVDEHGGAREVSSYRSLFEGSSRSKLCARLDGFSLEAAVRIPAGHRIGLEKLCRYLLRPAIAYSRLSLTTRGLVAYKLKTKRRGATHIVMTALECVSRIAGLVAPPYIPLVRYAGLLASHHRLRTKAIALAKPVLDRRALVGVTRLLPRTRRKSLQRARQVLLAEAPVSSSSTELPPLPSREPSLSTALVNPNYLPWALLLKRTFSCDVLACDCGGTRRVVDILTVEADVAAIRRTLERIHLPSAPPTLHPPRAGPEIVYPARFVHEDSLLAEQLSLFE